MNIRQKWEALEFWCNVLGISLVSERDLIQRYNSSLKFCIYDERNERHGRLHFHAILNNKKVASIYLDTLEVDFLSSRIKQSDKRIIEEWVKNNKELLLEIHQKENGEFEIPFLGWS